jgi:hypothetical protein
MKYPVLSFNVEIRLQNEEVVDFRSLRAAIERQVKCSLCEDNCVLSLEPTTREVIECDFCNAIDEAAKEQHPTLWNQGDKFVEIDHACDECLEEHADLLKRSSERHRCSSGCKARKLLRLDCN